MFYLKDVYLLLLKWYNSNRYGSLFVCIYVCGNVHTYKCKYVHNYMDAYLCLYNMCTGWH